MNKKGDSEHEEDYTESDDEGADGYRKGGYHVVTVGEIYNQRYQVIAKLGWGHFSTVWLCQDLHLHRLVAMKVQKSAPHYTEAAYDEIELLAEASKRQGHREWEATQTGPHSTLFPYKPFCGVVQLVDYFEHYGPNGKHVCMVFETMGPNLLALIKKYNFKGVPLDLVRKVSAHVLIGLDYLHRICGIIQTDLKPENVLVGCPKGVPVNKHGVPLVALPADMRGTPPHLWRKEQVTAAKSQQEPAQGAKGEKQKKWKKKKEKVQKAMKASKEVEEAEGEAEPVPAYAGQDLASVGDGGMDAAGVPKAGAPLSAQESQGRTLIEDRERDEEGVSQPLTDEPSALSDEDSEAADNERRHGGKTARYSWGQTEDEVHIFVQCPSDTKSKHVTFTQALSKEGTRVRLAVSTIDDTWILDGDSFAQVSPEDCTYTIEDAGEAREVHAVLVKKVKTPAKSQYWPRVLQEESKAEPAAIAESVPAVSESPVAITEMPPSGQSTLDAMGPIPTATAAAKQQQSSRHPPYMRPYLKPSRSDPTLLSSYGDDLTMMLTRMPYHHMQAMAGAQVAQLGAAYSPAAQQKPAAGQRAAAAAPGAEATAERPQLMLQTGQPLTQELIDEVMNLDIFSWEGANFKIVDLGNACWVERHFSDEIQTRQYRSPEVVIGSGYDTSTDIWSLACMIFELITGDYLFDPKGSDEYPRDEDHLALCVELLGPMPEKMIKRGRSSKTYFNPRGELRHIKSLRYWGMEDVLQQKYHIHPIEARNLASFLLPMLCFEPAERSSAHQLLSHPWLRGLPSPEVNDLFHPKAGLGLSGWADPHHPERQGEDVEKIVQGSRDSRAGRALEVA